MTGKKATDLIGYCGLACNRCGGGCPCKASREHGDPDCYQRECCRDRGLEGCWECDDFPCSNGYFAREDWRGFCIGSVHCILEVGPEEFLALAEANLDEEYGDYRFKSAAEVLAILKGKGPH